MPRKASIPVEANPELEDEVVSEDEGPKYRTLKYLGADVNWRCFVTSPALDFVDRVCDKVPETVAAVLIKNKKKNKLPLFKDITPGVKPLVNPETEGLPEEDDDSELWKED